MRVKARYSKNGPQTSGVEVTVNDQARGRVSQVISAATDGARAP
jgi:hypothetical protein